jgi:hypothetical protein
MTKARDLANASTALSAVSATELGYVDGVTSAIQTQLDAKLASSTAATTYQAINTNVSTTELGYLDGVTSAIQTQLNQKPEVFAGKNAVYNSGFDIAQRGTSFTGLSGVDYTLDRWVSWAQTGGQSSYVSRESVGNLSVTPNQAIRYCGRFGRTSGNTSTGARAVFQTLETADSIRFAGKTITMSFYARAGSGFTPTSGGVNCYVISGTGTDQIYYSFTGGVVVATSTVSTTTSWQRFSITGTVATNATELAILFNWSPVGTAGANDYVEITGVQLEEGSVATPFSRQNATIQGELAACQRYYYQIGPGAAYASFGIGGFHTASNSFMFIINTPVVMRVVPTFTTLGNFQTNGTGISLTGLGFNGTYSNSASYNGQANCSGATTGFGSSIRNTDDTTAKMMFSSEL